MRNLIATLSLIVFPLFSQAADFFSPELAAEGTAVFLNHVKTPAGFVDSLSASLSAEETAGLKRNFEAMKTPMDATLPVAKAAGNKVTFANTKLVIEFNSDRTFSVNGRIYKPYKLGQLDTYMEQMMKGSKPGSVLFSMMIPTLKAEAVVGGLLLEAIGMVAGIGAAVAVTVGTIAVYGGKEIYESIKQGKIECSGDFFLLRRKTRGFMLVASSKNDVLEPKVVNQAFGREVKCNDETAKELKNMIKAAKGEVPVGPPRAAPGTH